MYKRVRGASSLRATAKQSNFKSTISIASSLPLLAMTAQFLVATGLDPVIHAEVQFLMDRRIIFGKDGACAPVVRQ
jgi:hypothetical protein